MPTRAKSEAPSRVPCKLIGVFYLYSLPPLQASLQNLLDLAVMSLKVRGRSRHTPC